MWSGLGLGVGSGARVGVREQGADRGVGRSEVRHLTRVRSAAEAAVELVLAAPEEVDDVVRVLRGDLAGGPERLDRVEDPVAEPWPARVEARVV